MTEQESKPGAENRLPPNVIIVLNGLGEGFLAANKSRRDVDGWAKNPRLLSLAQPVLDALERLALCFESGISTEAELQEVLRETNSVLELFVPTLENYPSESDVFRWLTSVAYYVFAVGNVVLPLAQSLPLTRFEQQMDKVNEFEAAYAVQVGQQGSAVEVRPPASLAMLTAAYLSGTVVVGALFFLLLLLAWAK